MYALRDYRDRSRARPPALPPTLDEIASRAAARRRTRWRVQTAAALATALVVGAVAAQFRDATSGDEVVTATDPTTIDREQRDVTPADPTARGTTQDGVALSFTPARLSDGGGTATVLIESRGPLTVSFGLGARLEALEVNRWLPIYRLSGTHGPPVEPQAVPFDDELFFVHVGFTVSAGQSGTVLSYHIPALNPGSYRFVKDDLRDQASEQPLAAAIVEFEVAQ